MTNYENDHRVNLKSNAHTQKLIESGADNFDLNINDSISALVNQTALYRGISVKAARVMLINQLLETKK